ncbi:MAG: HD domain-containing protein [Bacteroidales bacterium]|nr:HD domain-containing protein [Bacteroidales bacterium]
MKAIRQDIQAYIKRGILPRYDSFDAAHRRDHVEMVIRQSLELAEQTGADMEMAYVIAAYHDTGLCEGRERHHLVSGRIIRADQNLLQWFSPEQIETMACAAEDHRASTDHAPRTLYGRIVAEADRFIDPETIVRRTVQFGLEHYPELDKAGHYERTLQHLHEKYGRNGYLKLWFTDSPNAKRLELLRQLIDDEPQLRQLFNDYWKNTHKP